MSPASDTIVIKTKKETDMREVKYILTTVVAGEVKNHPFYDFLSAEYARLEAKKDPNTEAAFILPASVYER